MVNVSYLLTTVLTQQVMANSRDLTPHNIDHELSRLSYLFPPEYAYTEAFTTSAFALSSPPLPYIQNLTHVSMETSSPKDTDSALGIHRAYSSHPIVPAPISSDPEQMAWEAFYPNGSINPSGDIRGGFGFYMTGPKKFKELLKDAKEVIFGYSVLFEEEWVWALGGKLPGVYGGIDKLAYGCTGGRTENRTSCFNLRLMWRREGMGELYAYLSPSDSNVARLITVPPISIQNPDYGFSVGRGAWTFRPGKWTTVVERVKLNDVEVKNGEIEIRIDGTSVISISGLELRTANESRIQGLHCETFFGGHKPDWASPRDQKAWFADISGAIIR